ncbi:LacI family DNA-binding transcriptional regulator [Lactobacillaceae bacterium 24-114]
MVAKLQDVAKLAGVSVTTVSRVINNYGSLSEKTINKVHEAMRQLNYQPNALARAMQGKPSKFIGLIFPKLTNPFFAELVNELEHQLFFKGYKTIIASSAENREIEHEYLNMLLANQVDGIISGSHNLGIEEYRRLSAPIISFDRYLADDIPIVSADSYRGGRLTAQFMVAHQVKKLAVIIDEDTSASPTVNRLQGVVDYLNEAQYDFQTLDKRELENGDFVGKYDGVIASNDIQALKIIDHYRNAHKMLNSDYYVTGYDGSNLIRGIAPYLPTVVQPIHEIANQLIKDLLQRIEQPNVKVCSPILPVKFVEPKK